MPNMTICLLFFSLRFCYVVVSTRKLQAISLLHCNISLIFQTIFIVLVFLNQFNYYFSLFIYWFLCCVPIYAMEVKYFLAYRRLNIFSLVAFIMNNFVTKTNIIINTKHIQFFFC